MSRLAELPRLVSPKALPADFLASGGADGDNAGRDTDARLCLETRGDAAEGWSQVLITTSSMSWLALWQAESGGDADSRRQHASALLAGPRSCCCDGLEEAERLSKKRGRAEDGEAER